MANLKEAQPSLPIFFLTEEQKLETVINCIRAGVTEVIQNPSDLRSVIEMTNSFLRRSASSTDGEEVTWEDMVEVERLLESSLGGEARSAESTVASRGSVDSPELKGKLDGISVRVPTINVSLVDLNVLVEKDVSVEAVNAAMKAAAAAEMPGVLAYVDEPLVSIDFNHNPHSSNYDSMQTKVYGKWVKVLAWYDNEWGFSNRMLDNTLALMQAK